MGRKVATKNGRGQLRKQYQTHNTDPSETIQSDAHLADINQILRDFARDGIKTLDEADLLFMDVSEFTDFQDLQNQNLVANQHFMSLPSKVREIFGHSLAVFLDTAHDQDKRDALVEAGFLKAPDPEPAAEVVPEVEPTAE